MFFGQGSFKCGKQSVFLKPVNGLGWFSSFIGSDEALLLEELEDSGQTSTSVVFMPTLTSESGAIELFPADVRFVGLKGRTRYSDIVLAMLEGAAFGFFEGATMHKPRRSDMTLAILEGLAFRFIDELEALEATGLPVNISALGSGGNSMRWHQIVADTLQRPISFCRANAEKVFIANLGPAEALFRPAGDAAPPPWQPPSPSTLWPDPQRTGYYRQRLALYRHVHGQVAALERQQVD